VHAYPPHSWRPALFSSEVFKELKACPQIHEASSSVPLKNPSKRHKELLGFIQDETKKNPDNIVLNIIMQQTVKFFSATNVAAKRSLLLQRYLF